MKSMPASSAMRASRRQSGQLADQRSGTLVAERPDEQLAPKMPILSGLVLYMAMRSRIDAERASTTASVRFAPRTRDSAPSARFSKFVIQRGTLEYELRKPKGTSDSMILVPLFDLKFLTRTHGT